MFVSNAVIDKVTITNDRGLMAWLMLDYGGTCQGFGGYILYAPEGWSAHESPNLAGHFIYRCMEITGVEEWSKMVGKTIRVRRTNEGLGGDIIAIGHIVKDDWFNVKEEFSKLLDAYKAHTGEA